MKSIKTCHFYQSKDTIFVNNIEEISQKIAKILPFSKIALISFSNDFFTFGKSLAQALIKDGLMVIEIIVSHNFRADKENFENFLSLPEDVRGVIAFDKRLIPLICSNFLGDKKSFFIENSKGTSGLLQEDYYLKDYDKLTTIPKSKQLYIMIHVGETKINNYIKSACLYVNMLIDYIFRQKLMGESIDARFVNKVKSILIDTLFIIKDGQVQAKNKIIYNLLFVEEMLAKNHCYYSCSAVVSSFLCSHDLFNIACSFNASKEIIEKYAKAFNKDVGLEMLDYNQVAKTIAFISRLNEKQVLYALNNQIKRINMKGLSTIKGEIKKLILLYHDFAKHLTEDLQTKDKSYEQNLHLSVSLSGFTPFGINGMTAVGE